MAYDNGHEEKHRPCSECGRYASERYDDGWAVRPVAPPERFSDGSTGSWTCQRCAGQSEEEPEGPASSGLWEGEDLFKT